MNKDAREEKVLDGSRMIQLSDMDERIERDCKALQKLNAYKFGTVYWKTIKKVDELNDSHDELAFQDVYREIENIMEKVRKLKNNLGRDDFLDIKYNIYNFLADMEVLKGTINSKFYKKFKEDLYI